MYARYVLFKSTAEHRNEMEELADQIFAYAKTLGGFVGATYLVTDDETEYGSFTVWESKEDSDSAGALMMEKALPKLGARLTAPPEIKVMKVYEPKA